MLIRNNTITYIIFLLKKEHLAKGYGAYILLSKLNKTISDTDKETTFL